MRRISARSAARGPNAARFNTCAACLAGGMATSKRPAAAPDPEPNSMTDRKQINFTIIPDDDSREPRTYANFCAVNHTPFDFTLTFCEVMPLSEQELRNAAQDHVVKAPVRTKVVVPVQFVPVPAVVGTALLP